MTTENEMLCICGHFYGEHDGRCKECECLGGYMKNRSTEDRATEVSIFPEFFNSCPSLEQFMQPLEKKEK